MKSKARGDNRKFSISDMYCTKCGNRGISIPRIIGNYREPGHLKKIYCYHCQEDTNHAECRGFGKYTYEDFKEEFELGRFIDGEKLPISKLKKCNKEECDYNKSGKCWNSNMSFKCDKRKGE